MSKYFLLTLFLCFWSVCISQNLNVQSALSQTSGLFENRGQIIDSDGMSVPNVLFYSESDNTRFYITDKGITFLFISSDPSENEDSLVRNSESKKISWEKIDLELIDANIDLNECIKQYPLAGRFNYFIPSQPNGVLDVQGFQRVVFKNIYPGIDWEIYMCPSKGIKYDFVLNGGANIEDLQLVYHSLEKCVKNGDGDLNIKTFHGNLKDHAPISYFNTEKISSHYTVDSIVSNSTGGYDNHYSIRVDTIWSNRILRGENKSEYLIIDPEITWSTFYGGGLADGPMSIETAPNGDTYVGGYRRSLNFPTFQDSVAYYQGVCHDSWGATILKFSSSGELLWSTLYDGTVDEEIFDIELDSQGNLYCVGETTSSDFPLQDNGAFYQSSLTGSSACGFILKFNSNGERVWATLVEGGGVYCHGAAIDNQDNLFVVGRADVAGSFPFMDNGNFYQIQSANSQSEGFVLKFDQNGNQLWGTAIGGTNIPTGSIGNDYAFGVDVNSLGELYVSGMTMSTDFPLIDNGQYFDNSLDGYIDAFLMKFSNSGDLIWSTLVGGNQEDYGKTVMVDHEDNVLLTGYTQSADMNMLNTHNGDGDFFVVKFNGSGQKLWGRYFGGNTDEIRWSQNEMRFYTYNDQIVADLCGNYYFFFETQSGDVNTLNNLGGYFENSLSGVSDQFLSILNTSGDELYGSYFGGSGEDFRASLAINSSGDLMLTGEWTSVFDETTYPIIQGDSMAYLDSTFNGLPDDMFFAKMKMANSENEHFCGAYNETDSDEVPFLSFPNVFSPNSDEINDFFVSIEMSGVATFEINIFNRWGVPVFNSLDTNFKWDGSDTKGIALAEGTYFWTASYTGFNDEGFERHGFVVLLK